MFDWKYICLILQDTERLLTPQQDCGDAVIQIMKVNQQNQFAKAFLILKGLYIYKL